MLKFYFHAGQTSGGYLGHSVVLGVENGSKKNGKVRMEDEWR